MHKSPVIEEDIIIIPEHNQRRLVNMQHYQFITVLVAVCLAWFSPFLSAEEIGNVDTKFKLFSPDHSIAIDVFDDPDLEGIACYISRAEKGGVKGTLGLAEETSHASIDCKQVGPVSIKGKLKNGERVFRERRSLIFKKLQVVRFIDETRNTVVYLAFSDRVIEGSPENSISAVSIMPWPQGSVVQVEK